MAAKNARMRTESMAQKLAKQPMSEGYSLMERGYNLGAMRLLTVKAETAPPFQLGPCLEAIATILLRLDEAQDAEENFGYAAEKYSLIQQPVLGEVMKIRGVEATQGPEAALKLIDDLITRSVPDGNAIGLPDGKNKQNVARAYHVRADLRMKVEPQQLEGALADAQIAVTIGWDRVFEGYATLGVIQAAVGDDGAARATLEKATQLNANYLPSFEALVEVLSRGGESARTALLAALDQAIALHPRAQLIRLKAFTLSEAGKDVEALTMLDNYVAKPPHEETEALFAPAGQSEAVFLKAKAAILGDQGRLEDAIAAVKQALEKAPGDEEASLMLSDLTELAAKNAAGAQ